MTAKTLNRNYRLKAANDVGNDAAQVAEGALNANEELKKLNSLIVVDLENNFINPKK